MYDKTIKINHKEVKPYMVEGDTDGEYETVIYDPNVHVVFYENDTFEILHEED